MNQKIKFLFCFGSFMMAFAIIMGAFGAHALKSVVSNDLMAVYHTAVLYHFLNTLSLFVLVFLYQKILDSKWLYIAIIVLIIGMIFFSVSLYLYVFLKLSWLIILTPIGGTLLVLSWVICFISILTYPTR